MNMSARRAEGAMGRPELFAAVEKKVEAPATGEGSYGEQKESDEEEPLQLEHMMGYSGTHRNTVLAIPGNDNIFIKSMGNLVCLENLLDPHDQKLLRGHDMPISAITVSASGSYIASGQVGTIRYKGRVAPIMLWDTASGQKITTLKGVTGQVTNLCFSQDERFLCGTGEDQLLYVWDVSSGEVVMGQRTLHAVTAISFVRQERGKHYTDYELCMSYGSVVASGFLSYDPSRVQWTLKLTPYSIPAGGGLVRVFTCIR